MSKTTLVTAATSFPSEHKNSLPYRSFIPKLKQAEPEAVARSLLDCIGIGTEAIIQAGEIAHFALKTYPSGSAERTRFFNYLVEAGFLSKSEARAEGQSPKISKLGTIGHYAKILRMPEVAAHLKPGYSTIYATAQYYKAVEDNSDPVSEVVGMLEKGAGDADREFIERKTKEVKRAKAAQAGAQKRASNEQVDSPHRIEDQKGDLVYLTPGSKDIKRFLADYAQPDALSTSYRVNELVGEAAVAVCVTELRNYPVTADVILPHSGFKYVRKVYLLERPQSAEVSEAKVAIVATKAYSHELPAINEPWECEVGDGKALAARLAPEACARLHVFAAETTSGWKCLTSENAWTEMPSLNGGA